MSMTLVKWIKKLEKSGISPAVVMLSVFAGCFLFLMPGSACAQAVEMHLTCARGIKIDGVVPGEVIVRSVFATIQTLLTKIGAFIYVQIVNTISFQAIIGVVMASYVAIYGAMIMLNLASHSLPEVTSRLLRMAFFYALLSYGVSSYIWFDRLVVSPFLGGMNDLITAFSAAVLPPGMAVIPPPLSLIPPINPAIDAFLNAVVAQSLDPGAVSALYIPMNLIFSPFYLIAIMSMMFLKGAGPIMALIMVWAFVEFALLMFNALIVYVRSIVGLTFMFGVAPIFIAFLLFQRTRDLFYGWLNVVIGFSISPVMLFAFLSFYAMMLTGLLQNMFVGLDFCWTKLFTIAGSTADVNWWRPAKYVTVDPVTLVPLVGDQRYWKIYSGDWDEIAPAINIVNILFFLFISHLGRQFSMFVGQLANQVADGIGVSSSPGMGVSNMLKSAVMSGRGTGKAGLGAFGPGAKAAQEAASKAGAIDSTVKRN